MKRRNVLLGLGALAFGSGATSFAAVNSEVAPGADLQVLADRKLTVRSIYDSEDGAAGSPNRSADVTLDESAPLPQINNTARSDLPEANTLNKSNSNFALNAAFEGNRGGSGTSGKFADIFLIENLTSSSRDVQISYKNKDQSSSGYGSDAADTYGNGGSSQLDPVEVQQLYKFQVGFASDTPGATGDRLSPSGGSTSDNHQGRSVTLEAGGQLGVRLIYDSTQTSNLSGYTSTPLYERINQIATDNIFAASGAYVDALDTLWVQDVS